MMQERTDAEALFIAHLPTINRVIDALCRRHGIRGDDADDFSSWVKTRFVENDYAVVRKFRGESSVSTYFAVVIAMQLREYRVAQWGRWRPSATAQRAGPIGVRLEMLIHRDGLPPTQAVRSLRGAIDTEMSDLDLSRLAAVFAGRPPIRPMTVGIEEIASVRADVSSDASVNTAVDAEEHEQTMAALARALQALQPEDQVIVRLRYWEEMSVADISRATGTDQKQMYRRLERALARLRARLKDEGLSKESVHTMLSRWDD